MMNTVKVWNEKVTIPTYDIGEPEKNPMFLEKRVYQGSSGSVYPYPVIEKISDEKYDKEWQAVFLENDYVKIMILPELGGRIQMAFDKTKNRHFIYYNRVIKPALVGLTGPWISGGIEFNWPQHHRPTTYQPVDYTIEENKDGSATVWCSELERMFRTKGMAGFTLYPDKSYLEIKVKLYNKTPFPQTFLWWANPAVHVNDEYQSVFPPDVNAVFDHGKRDVSSFPIATGTYYKVDYSPGTDISRYKNIPVPTSYMAITSKYDFVGGYENDSKGGVLHVANHHVSPGKKQWTWGNGEFGHSWDKNLTDEDGPYIELMCGVYTDNQPDFSWLSPNEEKSFVQYFMPYRDLGVVKNASKEAMLNLELENGEASIKVYTTGVYPSCDIELYAKGELIFSDKYDASPLRSYSRTVKISAGIEYTELFIAVKDAGKTLISWKPEGPNNNPVPEPAKPALLPKDIENNEQLYLTALHLEQYRHATFNPTDYYREALRRDAGDVRNNNGLGIWLMRRGKFSEAEKHFRKAIETLTQRNPNPYDGEPYYNLGLALKYQGKFDEAYEAFYKSSWNAGWQNPAYFNIAQIDCARGNFDLALEHINRSISRNTDDHKALHLKIAIFRKLGEARQALEKVDEELVLDFFNYGAHFEKYLLTKDDAALEHMDQLISGNIHNYIEYSLDYSAAGMFEEAIELLSSGIKKGSAEFPMAWYYLAWFHYLSGANEEARKIAVEASKIDPGYCFPNQIESVIALNACLGLYAEDAKAYYYLGNFWYASKQYEDAISCWEKSTELDDQFPTAFRNLSLGYFNKKQDAEKAVIALEKAFSLDPSDARILMELDQLYKRLNRDLTQRLELLEKYSDLVERRDDLYLEQLTIYNLLGQHEKAYEMLMRRKFHPWEGGEGKVSGQYILSLTEMAKKAYFAGDYQQAIDYLQNSLHYPDNLSEGKLYGVQENDVYYWLGCAYSKQGNAKRSIECWQKAAVGLSEPAAAIFYNDQPPEKIFYQGLALLKLCKKEEANRRFNKLIEYGKTHIDDEVRIDYFAVSLPDLLIWDDDLKRKNIIHCKFMIGLGLLGMGNRKEANRYFDEALAMDPSHIGVNLHKRLELVS